MVDARKQKPAAIDVYLLSLVDIVIRYIEVVLRLGFWIIFVISKNSLFRGSIPSILLQLWPGHKISFVISRTSLNRGSLNRGSTVLCSRSQFIALIMEIFFGSSIARVKPRPNDRKIVRCNMLCAFGHPVATCCNMLGVVCSNLKMVKFFMQHL